MGRRYRAVGLAVMVLAAACSGDDGGATGPTSTVTEDTAGGDEAGTWTILQYQMADTDLEPFLMEDVEEMGSVGSNANLDIVALVDRSPDYGDDVVLDQGAWVGARLLHVQEGTADVLAELGDVNLGDPEVLATFISEGVAAFPADNYALVISDHGASWPGVGPDETAGFDTLGLEELRTGIADGLEAAGLETFDILGFDACLMASYEVASTLAPVADRLIASSELEPGHGWDYTVLDVAADDGASPDELGTAIVDGFLAQAEAVGTEADVTLAMIDLRRMEALDDALADFSAALAERTVDVAPTVGRTLARNPGYGRSPDPAEDTFMTDLGTLAATIGIDALDVSDEADAVLRAIGDAVTYKVSGPLAPDFSGFSIYFPPEPDYFDPRYESLPASPGGWIDFLAAYYQAGDAIPPEELPTFTTGEAVATFDEDGLNVEGTLELAAAGNIAEATITYGLVEDDGSVTFLGDEPAEAADDGSGDVFGFYDLTFLTLGDGIDTVPAYLSLTYEEGDEGFAIDVPMAYYAPDDIAGETYQDVLLHVIVDGEGNVSQETYYAYDDDSGTYGELTAEPTGIIVPEVVNVDADGNPVWSATSDVGLFADLPSIAYDLEALPSGTVLYVELSVTDFGGNSESISTQVVVP